MLKIICATEFTEADYSAYEGFVKTLPVTRQRKILRHRTQADKLRMIIGDVLSYTVLATILRVKLSDLTLSENLYGKPICSSHPDIYFNTSHSGHWVVCAADSAPIGIDIEKIAPIDYLSISHEFFSANEHATLIELLPELQLSFFYKLWTAKESYLKAIGTGLNLTLDSFEIGDSTIQIGDANWYCNHYTLDPDYEMAVTSNRPTGVNSVQKINTDDLRVAFERIC